MRFKKKAIWAAWLLAGAALLAVPSSRDQLSWYWAASDNDAPAYARYLLEEPHGRHVGEAKARYEDLSWKDKNRALIAEAVKKHDAVCLSDDARQQRKVRLERFFWQQVTNENSIASYQGYLSRYPTGEFAALAKQKAASLTSTQ